VHVSKQILFAQIPQVDKLLHNPRIEQLEKKFPRQLIVEVIREELANQRKKIQFLKNDGIICKLIPVPRHLSSDCGVCVCISSTDKEAALNTLKTA
jgi:hypothetical protein